MIQVKVYACPTRRERIKKLLLCVISSCHESKIYQYMHTATYINNNCTIDLPPSSNWQMRLANQRPCTNTPPQTVDKVWAKHVAMLFENKGKVFWGHADWSMSSNSHSLVCFACLSGWSYLISLLVRGQLQFSNRNASHHLVSKSWGQTIHLLLFFCFFVVLTAWHCSRGQGHSPPPGQRTPEQHWRSAAL